MTLIRYFNAFLLSCLTFALLYVVSLALPKKEKIVQPAPSKVIKIALVTPVKKPIIKKEVPKPIVAPILPPVPLKKVVKKSVIKKRITKKSVIKKPKKIVKKKRVVKKKIVKKRVIKKHKPKKVIKKKVIKKRVIKREVVKKQVVEEYVEPYIAPAPVYVAPKPKVAPIKQYVPAPKPVARATPQPINQPTLTAPAPMVQNDHNRKAFLQNVRSQIIANKTYPRIAKRRHIEGDIKVRFNISRSGEVSNIRFINGKRIFYKSVKKAIERTFPIAIPSNVTNELPIMDVSVTLHFNLR